MAPNCASVEAVYGVLDRAHDIGIQQSRSAKEILLLPYHPEPECLLHRPDWLRLRWLWLSRRCLNAITGRGR